MIVQIKMRSNKLVSHQRDTFKNIPSTRHPNYSRPTPIIYYDLNRPPSSPCCNKQRPSGQPISLADGRIEDVNVTASDVLMVQLFHCAGGIIFTGEEHEGVACGSASGHVNDDIRLLYRKVSKELGNVSRSCRIR